MRRHLSMRSGNPTLNQNTFKNLSKTSSSDVMTIDGAVNKTTLSCHSRTSAQKASDRKKRKIK